uniref:Zinc-finger domain-containing protein n=1 Tax=candidate division WOR-3 bacterium TaxID=2052148 RepID=A0A7V3VUU4_UNCW3
MNFMNECKNKDKVIKYVEMLMDEQEKNIFERHLDECETCRQELIAIKKFYEVMGKDEVPLPESIFFEKLRDRIRDQNIEFKTPFWKITSILAPVLGIVILFILFNIRKEQFVEIPVSVSNLSTDNYLNDLLLDRIIDDELVNKLTKLDHYFEYDTEQSLTELTQLEKEDLIKTIFKKYKGKYL